MASAWAAVTVADLSATILPFAALAAAAVLHGQRSAVRFADVWFSALTRRPPSGLDPDPFLGLRDTAAPLPAVLASSSAYVRHALAVGHEPEIALSYGLRRAERLAATEVYRAGTDAVAALATRSGSPGWRRQLGRRPCPVCVGLADGSIEPWSAKLAAHPHCSCLPEPVRP